MLEGRSVRPVTARGRDPDQSEAEDLRDRCNAVLRLLDARNSSDVRADLHSNAPDYLCTLAAALESEQEANKSLAGENLSMGKMLEKRDAEIEHLRECHARIAADEAHAIARVFQVELLLQKVTAERDELRERVGGSLREVA